MSDTANQITLKKVDELLALQYAISTSRKHTTADGGHAVTVVIPLNPNGSINWGKLRHWANNRQVEAISRVEE